MSVSRIESDLSISDVEHVVEQPVEELYDRIITLCMDADERRDSCPAPDLRIGLEDRDVEQQDAFDSAVEAVFEAMEADGHVLVHCMSGVSRSPAVVATAMARRDGISFDRARRRILARREIFMHPALVEAARRHLEAHR